MEFNGKYFGQQRPPWGVEEIRSLEEQGRNRDEIKEKKSCKHLSNFPNLFSLTLSSMLYSPYPNTLYIPFITLLHPRYIGP